MIRYSLMQNPSPADIGYVGKGTIKFNVTGYDPQRSTLDISVERRNSYTDGSHYWQITHSLPDWGRDREAADNIEVVENIRQALGEAVTMMKDLQTAIPVMEVNYQRGEADRKAIAEAKAAEEKAAYDADKAVGKKLAKQIIDKMVNDARTGESYKEHSIVMFTRGKRQEQNLKVHFTGYSKLTLFNLGWSRIAKKKALEMLADSAIDALKVDGIQFVDPKVAKFLLGEKNG